MSEGRKIGGAVLIAELFVCLTWGAMLTLHALGLLPAIRAATNIPVYVAACVLWLALVLWIFNLVAIASSGRRYGRALALFACAVLLLLLLLMVSLAQY
jgi:hypothetical protein